MALGIFDMRWPPYAADITLELHQNRQTNKAFVKVSYAGQVRGKILNAYSRKKYVIVLFPQIKSRFVSQDQLIPGCSGVYCPLQEFKQVLSAHSLSSELYRSRCNSPEGRTEI